MVSESDRSYWHRVIELLTAVDGTGCVDVVVKRTGSFGDKSELGAAYLRLQD